MCIAIYKPRRLIIPEDVLENCFANNPDGAGFAVAHAGRLTVKKGYFTFGEFIKAFRKHAKKASAIHFRVATSGKVDKNNCHPFRVSEHAAIIHNGILPWPNTASESDTACFVEDVLKADPVGLFECPVLKESLEDFIGRHNKIVAIDGDGRYNIFCEAAGKWVDDCWFSNETWMDWSSCYVPKQIDEDESWRLWR